MSFFTFLNNRWLKLSLSRKGYYVLVLPILALIISSYLFFFSIHHERNAISDVDSTLQIIDLIYHIHSNMFEAVGAAQQIVLNHDTRVLAQYKTKRSEVFDSLEELTRLMADNNAQKVNLAELRDLIIARFTRIEMLLLQPGQNPAVEKSAVITEGRKIMLGIFQKLSAMEEVEKELLTDRRDKLDRARSDMVIAIIVSFIIGIAGGITTMFLFSSSIIRRINNLKSEIQQNLSGTPSEGELSKTDEIGSLQHIYRYALIEVDKQIGEQKKAKHEAEKASTVKSHFLAHMSHEIRTPLNGITGMLELLKSTKCDNDQMHYVSTALNAITRLTRLLSEMLDVTKFEANRLELQHKPFDLHETMEALYQLFLPEALGKNIELRLSVDPTLPRWVNGDELRLHEVLCNVTGNAIKFTDKGFVEIKADYSQGARRPNITFTITDSGKGIPEDSFNTIFEPFTQLDVDENRHLKGAGFGLTISKALIRLMRGRINITSEVGRGTSFHLTLPLPSVEAPPLPVSKDRQSQNNTGRLNILLVEDDPISQFYQKSILEKMGHLVTIADNGIDALQMLSSNTYDLAFMDIQLPEMDGTEVTKAVRTGAAGETNIDIPIIAVTAYAMNDERARIMEFGLTDYLTKPINKNAFETAIGNNCYSSSLPH